MRNRQDSGASVTIVESETQEPRTLSFSSQQEDLPAQFSESSAEAPRFGGKVVLTALAIGLIGLFALLFGIHRPSGIIFDEWWYVPAAKAILAGNLQNMDPGEPPMGKLLIAVGIKMAGDNSTGWRVSGGVFGALALVAVFLWTQALFAEYRISVYAAALTLFNNFLFVMSRIGMLDVFLVCFMLWAVLAYTAAFRLDISTSKRRILLACSGFLFGLSGACKWNAIDTLATLLVISLAAPWIFKFVSVPSTSSLSRFAEKLRSVGIPSLLLALVLLPAFSYSLVYWVLFRIVHLPFSLHELAQVNYAMWRFHVRDTFNPNLLRHWYQWPFAISPIRLMSYLLGNPVVMWGGFLAVWFCLWRGWKSLGVSEGLVALLYLANLLQWAVTPSRNAHYYYYFPAAMFLGVTLAYAVHRLPKLFGIRVSVIVMAAAVVVFVWCYPRMAHLDAPWDCALGCWI